jgi:hypothetical protein
MMIRALIPGILIVLASLTIAACSVVERVEPTPAPTSTETSFTLTPPPIPTPEPTPTATPTVIPERTATPTPESTATPEPTPTAEPEPPVRTTVTETPCCGLFEWITDNELIVYEDPPDGDRGSYVVDVSSGDRRWLSDGYGLPSPGGIIAIVLGSADQVRAIDRSGAERRIFDSPSNVAWPSPDGSRVALLERLPVRTPSSTVDRSVELRIADIESGAIETVLQLQTADVQWLPDNRHVLVSARTLDMGQAGIWLIDTVTGSYDILFEELFLRAARLSPDGDSVAFMRTFNEDPAQNGVWVMDLESRDMHRVFESGSFRWDPDGDHIWRLDMSQDRAASDSLLLHDAISGDVERAVQLEGRVLNDVWSISPGRTYVAYWRLEDDLVAVESLD